MCPVARGSWLTPRLKPAPEFYQLAHLPLVLDTLATTVAHLPERLLPISVEQDLQPLAFFKRRCSMAPSTPGSQRHNDLGLLYDFSGKLIDVLASHGGIPYGSPFTILCVPYKACQVGCRLQTWQSCTGGAPGYRTGPLRLICSRVSLTLPFPAACADRPLAKCRAVSYCSKGRSIIYPWSRSRLTRQPSIRTPARGLEDAQARVHRRDVVARPNGHVP